MMLFTSLYTQHAFESLLLLTFISWWNVLTEKYIIDSQGSNRQDSFDYIPSVSLSC